MIAGGEVDAEGRSERLERRDQAVEIAFGAVEKVAGKKDDIGLETRGQGNQAAAETDAVDGPEVQIAEQDSAAAAPGRGQIGKLDGDAADADHAGVEEAVDAGERGYASRERRREAGGSAGIRRQVGEGGAQTTRSQTRQRRPEEEVEKAEPDGRDPIKEPGRQNSKTGRKAARRRRS